MHMARCFLFVPLVFAKAGVDYCNILEVIWHLQTFAQEYSKTYSFMADRNECEGQLEP